MRPPQTKCMFAWDVQVVLNYIKHKWGCTSTFSDKEIGLKLGMLSALTTYSRAPSLHCLDIRYLVNTSDKVIFHFKLHKNWRKDNAPPSLIINSYSADKDLRVIKSLYRYLEVTEERRENTTFIMSFKKPYKEIVSGTVSGWIKAVMKLADINRHF